MINDSHGRNNYSADFSETEYLSEQIREALASMNPAWRDYILSVIEARYDELMRYLREDPLGKLPIEVKAISNIRNIFSLCVGVMAPLSAFSSAVAEKEYTAMAVASYLVLWLDACKDATQSINSFVDSDYRYITKSNRSRKTQSLSNSIASDKRNFHRKYDKWVEALTAAQKYAEWTGYPAPALPQKINNFDIPLQFSTLCFCEMYLNKKLSLYDDLVNSRNFFAKNVKGKDFSHVKASIDDHNEMYEDAKNINDVDPRRYVATCAFLLKYEEAFKFTMTAKMVQHYVETAHAASLVDSDNFLLACFGSLYNALTLPALPGSLSLRTVNDTTLDRDIDSILRVVLKHKDEIESLVFTDEDQESIDVRVLLDRLNPEIHKVCDTYLGDRRLFAQAFSLLIKVYSPMRLSQIQWSDDLFKMAAQFFESEYPIIKNYTSIDLGDEKRPGKNKPQNPAYPLFIEHYEYGGDNPNQSVNFLRVAIGKGTPQDPQ